MRALGSGVDAFAVGDRVVAFAGAGGLAEVALARAELAADVPLGLDLEHAAAAPGALSTGGALAR